MKQSNTVASWAKPVTLAGDYVLLEPLSMAHVDALKQAVTDGNLWKLWYTSVPHPDNTEVYVQAALNELEQGNSLPFAVRQKSTGRIVGTTRYCNIDSINFRLEIGHTWYAKSVQRSAVNTECKLLLLQHAFDELAAIAVEFRTHWHNRQSRRAIARLGAKQDGVLRNHRKSADGIYRDTVVFSVIDQEWPAVCQNLKAALSR